MVPGASTISDSLHPSERLSQTCQPAEGAEPRDRSPSSVGPLDFNNMDTSLSTDMARESPQVQVGAQPDPGEPSQEQVEEQQVSWSQQLPDHSSQVTVLDVPAGNSPCLVEEKIPGGPGSFLFLQEAAPIQPPNTNKASKQVRARWPALAVAAAHADTRGVPGSIRPCDGGIVFSSQPDGTCVPLEIVLMEKVGFGCRRIIQFLDWLQLPDSFVLVMECPEQSRDLLHVLQEQEFLSEEAARWLFWQVLEAVWHCTACSVLHRDIKPENLLINPDTGDMKLIDFGCGTFLQERACTQFASE
ncbi:serine/threonine-protein kinase pim-2-like, partial [Cyanistes caeruleus]|uniref:serine/threonine-protein kinase pim-2-like n=1 Tax=Cyanistes caeruleus TaxID=156563 RepID=UPI000CDA0B3F